jgi:hypothetical protein
MHARVATIGSPTHLTGHVRTAPVKLKTVELPSTTFEGFQASFKTFTHDHGVDIHWDARDADGAQRYISGASHVDLQTGPC